MLLSPFSTRQLCSSSPVHRSPAGTQRRVAPNLATTDDRIAGIFCILLHLSRVFWRHREFVPRSRSHSTISADDRMACNRASGPRWREARPGWPRRSRLEYDAGALDLEDDADSACTSGILPTPMPMGRDIETGTKHGNACSGADRAGRRRTGHGCGVHAGSGKTR